jgi:hypothetical protein
MAYFAGLDVSVVIRLTLLERWKKEPHFDTPRLQPRSKVFNQYRCLMQIRFPS